MKQSLAQTPLNRTKPKLFNCEFCDYNTSHKGSYDRHLNTQKHDRHLKMKQTAQTHNTRKYECKKCKILL